MKVVELPIHDVNAVALVSEETLDLKPVIGQLSLQLHNGYPRFRDGAGLYFNNERFLHRVVAQTHGWLAPDCEVHHKNKNKCDSCYWNLRVLLPKDHQRLHRENNMTLMELRIIKERPTWILNPDVDPRELLRHLTVAEAKVRKMLV